MDNQEILNVLDSTGLQVYTDYIKKEIDSSLESYAKTADVPKINDDAIGTKLLWSSSKINNKFLTVDSKISAINAKLNDWSVGDINGTLGSLEHRFQLLTQQYGGIHVNLVQALAEVEKLGIEFMRISTKTPTLSDFKKGFALSISEKETSEGLGWSYSSANSQTIEIPSYEMCLTKGTEEEADAFYNEIFEVIYDENNTAEMLVFIDGMFIVVYQQVAEGDGDNAIVFTPGVYVLEPYISYLGINGFDLRDNVVENSDIDDIYNSNTLTIDLLSLHDLSTPTFYLETMRAYYVSDYCPTIDELKNSSVCIYYTKDNVAFKHIQEMSDNYISDDDNIIIFMIIPFAYMFIIPHNNCSIPLGGNNVVIEKKGIYIAPLDSFIEKGALKNIQILLTTSNYNFKSKIKKTYLPDSCDYIIINSSTEGSNKQFRLTVDDTGLITAKELGITTKYEEVLGYV